MLEYVLHSFLYATEKGIKRNVGLCLTVVFLVKHMHMLGQFMTGAMKTKYNFA